MNNLYGISGMPRSGKDTLALAMVKQGYFGVSLGDIVRDAARIRHSDKPDPIAVANMTETANHLRQEKGPDFALKIALDRYTKFGREALGLVLFSIRAPIEVDFIEAEDGHLAWIEASSEVRYQRTMRAKRVGEPDYSFDDFLAQEALQWIPQPSADPLVQMNMSYVKSKANIIVNNNGDDSEEVFIDNALKSMGVLNV